MSTFKRAKVVMLPTAKASMDCISKCVKITDKAFEEEFVGKLAVIVNPYYVDNYNNGTYSNHTPHHIYIISDDEIKEGDWIVSGTNTLAQCIYPENVHHKDIKKIIATTDNSLFVTQQNDYLGQAIIQLPQPSETFIQKYVEEHNKGNVITDVMVEYKTMNKGYTNKLDKPYQEIDILKVNSKENTITIKKVKDTFTKEDLIKFGSAVYEEYTRNQSMTDFTNKWVENNL